MRLVIVVAVLATVFAREIPSNLQDPGELALLLSEDEFEDYLDQWLEFNQTRAAVNDGLRSGCSIRVNGDLGQPQPVYIHNNNYIVPTGNTGIIHLNSGEQVTVCCTRSGSNILHPNIAATVNTAVATCVNNALVSGAGWLNGHGAFGGLTCSGHAYHEAISTNQRCYNNNVVISVGFSVEGTFYPLYWSCFDQSRLEVLYVWYEQNPPNAVHQTGVDRPSWLAGTYYPGVGINTQYTQVQQKARIASLVGAEQADKYVTSSQYLARGHLAAKTDFIFATGQRATFYFINAAPQWQPFNAGNWNWLEQNLRVRIGQAGYNTVVYTGTYGVTQLRDQSNRPVDIYLYYDSNNNPQLPNLRVRIGQAGYNTVVYTGTYGVTQLRDQSNRPVDIYLYYDNNNNPQLPVPLYFYKVVYDKSRRLGVAFVSINNPYYSAAEVRSLQFCTDRCRNNNAFSWLNWQPDRIDYGYSFCCSIDEFRRVIPHLPDFDVIGLLS